MDDGTLKKGYSGGEVGSFHKCVCGGRKQSRDRERGTDRSRKNPRWVAKLGMADFCFVEVEASNTEVAVWRLLAATGELRHFYENGVGEAPTFSSEMGESVLGIEIADGLRGRAVEKFSAIGVEKL